MADLNNQNVGISQSREGVNEPRTILVLEYTYSLVSFAQRLAYAGLISHPDVSLQPLSTANLLGPKSVSCTLAITFICLSLFAALLVPPIKLMWLVLNPTIPGRSKSGTRQTTKVKVMAQLFSQQ